jgi:hypothetical protein
LLRCDPEISHLVEPERLAIVHSCHDQYGCPSRPYEGSSSPGAATSAPNHAEGRPRNTRTGAPGGADERPKSRGRAPETARMGYWVTR